MSRIACLVVSVLLVETLFSQETPKLVAFDTLLANPQPYSGKTIALHCIVDKSDPTTGFTLIDAQIVGATEKPRRSSLRATWMKDVTVVSVEKGQEAIVIGRIQMQDKTPIFQVANIITDKSAVRRFIRPSERRPRPGDNLGHDAQPSKSLSD